ncbi:MAG TPA: hypothetical protein VIN61_13665 [Gammaproteobacteria bacterium]
MPHVIEPATSSRAKCRGCGRKIEKGELRFGDREPSMFGDGEMTLWFHPLCAAYKRPEPLLETIERERVPDADRLIAAARLGLEHRRLPRLHGAERAPTGRARCRHCRNLIEKDTWRIPLVFFEEARFEPSGFIHAGCARGYFGTADVLDRVRQFSPDLTDADLADLARALG